MNICLILSSGTSTRFGKEIPKQYNFLGGKEVLAYSIDAAKRAKCVDKIIISANTEYVSSLRGRYDVDVTIGGATRNQSLQHGLEYIAKNYPQCKKLFNTEAARPFITPELVHSYFNKLDEYDAVITAQHITDSLGKYGKTTINRADYYLVQAPEAFRFDLLYRHFDECSLITATSQQLPSDSKIYLNFNFRHNLKITYPEDLVIAESLMGYINGKNSSI